MLNMCTRLELVCSNQAGVGYKAGGTPALKMAIILQ